MQLQKKPQNLHNLHQQINDLLPVHFVNYTGFMFWNLTTNYLLYKQPETPDLYLIHVGSHVHANTNTFIHTKFVSSHDDTQKTVETLAYFLTLNLVITHIFIPHPPLYILMYTCIPSPPVPPLSHMSNVWFNNEMSCCCKLLTKGGVGTALAVGAEGRL